MKKNKFEFDEKEYRDKFKKQKRHKFGKDMKKKDSKRRKFDND